MVINRKRIFIRVLSVICLGALFVGCKPTEKNYQAAYQAAQNKRKADAAVDPDMAIPAKALQSFDAPRTKEVDGEQLRLKRFFIKYIGKGDAPEIGRLNVAVAKYKMPTNVIAQTEDLRASGLNAFPVEGSDGSFYVIAGSFPTYEEVSGFIKEYKKKHPASSVVGLDGEPLVSER